MIAKELRALFPAWAACAVALLACTGVDGLQPFGAAAYFIGSAAVGAMAIGHEYTAGTLHMLLSQPVPRARLLFAKLAVLAALLAVLLVLAAVTVSLRGGDALLGPAFLWLPVLTALFVAPWLTLASRSALGGTVFTVGAAGLLLVTGQWIGVARYGYTRQVDAFRITLLWQSMAVLCVAGAVMTWILFARLQVIDGRGREVDFAPAATVAGPGLTRHNAIWLLVRKELRIQQLAFVIAIIYAVLYLAASALNAQSRAGDMVFGITLIYAGLLAAVIGAMGSAEERNLRTHDAQLLLPVRTAVQWRVKAGVALALTLLLTVALPILVVTVLAPGPMLSSRLGQPMFVIRLALVLTAITALCLYVSSLCSSGLWALVASMPAMAVVVLLFGSLAGPLPRIIPSLHGRFPRASMDASVAFVTAVVVVILLHAARTNHRSAEPGGGDVAGQIAMLAGVIGVAVVMIGVAGVLSR